MNTEIHNFNKNGYWVIIIFTKYEYWHIKIYIMNKYWLETSKETERAIALCCTGSTMVSILSEFHQKINK